MSENQYFRFGVEKRSDIKKPEKRRTRLCVDCAKTTYEPRPPAEQWLDRLRWDTIQQFGLDGNVKAHYVEKEYGFIEGKPRGRKVGRCPKHKKEWDQQRDRKRKRKEREDLKQQDRSDCKYLAGCLKEYVPREYKTLEEMQRKLCFDCEGDDRP